MAVRRRVMDSAWLTSVALTLVDRLGFCIRLGDGRPVWFISKINWSRCLSLNVIIVLPCHRHLGVSMTI